MPHDAQVTQSKKAAGATPVGERLPVEKVGKGGLVSLEFKPEDRDGKVHFRGNFFIIAVSKCAVIASSDALP